MKTIHPDNFDHCGIGCLVLKKFESILKVANALSL